MHRVHCSVLISSIQNFWIHCNSSFFVFGSELAIFLFIWFHTISIGLMSGLSEGQTVHQLIPFSYINCFAMFGRCFGSLSCWNLWESVNLSLMNGRRLSLKMLLVKNYFSIMPSNIVILEGPLLVIAAHTCTLRGCFGFCSAAGNVPFSLYITVLIWCSWNELSSEKMMSSNVSLVSISIYLTKHYPFNFVDLSHQLTVARLGSSKSDCLYGAFGCWQTKLCISSLQLVVYLSDRCGRICFEAVNNQFSNPNGHLSKSRPICCILVIVDFNSVVGFEPVTDGVAGYLMSLSIHDVSNLLNLYGPSSLAPRSVA